MRTERKGRASFRKNSQAKIQRRTVKSLHYSGVGSKAGREQQL
jgi:hypothetical protein